jgi:hypothetical protein
VLVPGSLAYASIELERDGVRLEVVHEIGQVRDVMAAVSRGR